MKHPGKLWHVAIAIVFALGITFAKAGPISAHAPGNHSSALKTLRLGIFTLGDPTLAPDVDPAFISDTASDDVNVMVYANLVQLTPAGRPEPDLATWSVSKNHKVYTFTIRKNARFSDGKAVTAYDAVFGIRRALSPALSSSCCQSYGAHILGYAAYNAGKSKFLGVKALNAHKVQIKLDAPIAYFTAAMSYPIFEPLEAKRVNGHKPETYLASTCAANVGAGPFKFVCANRSSNPNSFYGGGRSPAYTMVPNKYFYGRKPNYRVVIPGVADTQTGYSAFQAGQLDWTQLPAAIVQSSQNKPGFIGIHSSGVEYLSLNFDSAPFNNLHCRLAMSYAIDRGGISRNVYHGTRYPLSEILPPALRVGYNSKGNPQHYDPAKAKAELKLCPSGINVTFLYRHTSVDYDNEAAAIQQQLKSVGINVTLKGLTRPDWLKYVTGGPMEKLGAKMVWNDWFQDYPDPQDYMDFLLTSGSPQNASDFKSAAYDKFVRLGNTTLNKKKRDKYYAQAEKIAMDNVAWVTLQNIGFQYLVKPSVKGLVSDYTLAVPWPKNNDWSSVKF